MKRFAVAALLLLLVSIAPVVSSVQTKIAQPQRNEAGSLDSTAICAESICAESIYKDQLHPRA